MAAKVLILDIETQRAVVETFSLFRPFIHVDRVLVPTRVLCFAAKWRGDDNVVFRSAWRDDDEAAYRRMLKCAFDLLSAADFVVTWNGDRFDLQWLEGEFGRLELGRPTPYRSVDLIKTAKRWFRAANMSMKLEWSARMWLRDGKLTHGTDGGDMWHDIRYGSPARFRAATRQMRAYNVHDTELTERVFERYLPWLNLNLAAFEPGDGVRRCTKCASPDVKRDGSKYYATAAGLYQMYRCKTCGASSRGPRRVEAPELRPA